MKTFSIIGAFVALTLAMTACGDDEGGLGGGADAAVSSDAAPLADAEPGAPDAAPTSTVLAVGTDYGAGTSIVSTIEVPSLTVTTDAVSGVVSADPAVRYVDGRLYFINRFGADNITIVDPNGLTFIDQVSTGPGSNPQDVAVVGDKIYVPTFAGKGLVVIDISVTTPVAVEIDLSSLDAVDGVPNCNAAAVAGGNVFVACGQLDDNQMNLPPRGPGKVAVIDPSNDTLVTTVTLINENPFTRLLVTPAAGGLGGDILVDTVGASFATPTASCLERVSTGATPASNGCLVQHATLGGRVNDLGWSGDTLWIAHGTASGSALTSFDPMTMTLASSPTSTTGQDVAGLAVCPTGEVVFHDNNTDFAMPANDPAGLRVYGADGVELTTDVLDIGLPPLFSAGIVCY